MILHLHHIQLTSEPIPQALIESLTHRKYTRKVILIAQSKALSPTANEPTSLLRDDRQGEAFPTVFSLDTQQDRENIAKTSALPHESSPMVTSLDEISELKARVKFLEDKEKRSVEPTQEDAPITEGIMEIGEELGADKSTELGSNDTKEMVNVLTSMEAANILTSRGAAASVSPVDVLPAASVPTVSGSFPTVSAIFTTASVEQIDAQVAREIEEEFARENQRLSEQLARDSEITKLHAEEELKMMIEGLDRSNEVISKHLQEYEQAEADLTVGEKIELINELVKYQDHCAKILKYQAQQSKPLLKKEQREFYMSILRSHAGWKTKHFRGMTLEQLKEKFIPKREYWKIIRLGGHTAVYQFFVNMLKQLDREDLHQLWTLVKEIFSIKQATRDKEKELWVELKRLFEPDFEDQLWTHHQAFMHDPLDWKLYDTCSVHHVFTKDEEIFMLIDQGSAKRMKTSKEVSEEELQGMMQLVPLEEVYVKALQVKHPIIDWEIHSE
nr:hypothetical protein [Tanacetum cinerariifolium]